MGKIQNLTKEQKSILDQVRQDDYLRSRFYFTGGTALSAVYLQHRYSDDIDLFSKEKIETQAIFALVERWSEKLSFTFEGRFAEVVYIFNLTFFNKETLKVDF